MPSDLPIRAQYSSAIEDARERELAELVDRFYSNIRGDEVLGPIFEANVRDWQRHLMTMRRFWSSAIYRTGRYSGRPLEAHMAIEELEPEHFPRWLRLWEATVEEVVRSDARDRLTLLAGRMALTMQARVGLRADG